MSVCVIVTLYVYTSACLCGPEYVCHCMCMSLYVYIYTDIINEYPTHSKPHMDLALLFDDFSFCCGTKARARTEPMQAFDKLN